MNRVIFFDRLVPLAGESQQHDPSVNIRPFSSTKSMMSGVLTLIEFFRPGGM